jgi:lipopolysaccharide/colanic/teichoic acid biosynthesis glycosyltransferase
MRIDMLRRTLDVLGSSFLLILCSPLLLLTAFAVWATDQGPALYRQTRVGKDRRTFELLKFRSMRVNNLSLDRPGEVAQTDPLVTLVGRIIRRLKIDELPQLINVLRGDMSWIGPRPTILSQVEKYTAFQMRRLEILPGMTGWAQVNGGVEVSWPERIILDVWYIDHRSTWLDLRILATTVGVILFGHRQNRRAINQALHHARANVPSRELRLPEQAQPATNGTQGISLKLRRSNPPVVLKGETR